MKKYAYAAALILITGACLKKEDFDFNKLASTTWSPEVGLPLINSRLTAKELFTKTDSTVYSSPGGLSTLTYRGKEVSFPAAGFMDLSLPGTQIQVPIINGSTNQSISLSTPNGEEIRRVLYSSGELSLSVDNGSGANYSITFSNLVRGGAPIVLNVSGSGKASVDLSNAELNMTPANSINLNIAISNATGAGMADIGLNFTDVVWKRIEGDFKSRQVDIGTDTMKFNLFKNVSASGQLTVDDPKMNIYITNGFGIPFKLDFNQFQSVNSASGEVKNFSYSQSQNIAPAGVSGKEVTTKLVFDKSNSQIRDLIKPTPSFVFYDAHITANPAGTVNNYITDASTLRMTSEFVLPLKGSIFMSLRDTTPVGVVFDYEEIQGVTVRISSVNGFPFGAELDLVLMDEFKQPLLLPSGAKASLVSNVNIFKAAGVDSDGKVNAAAEARVDIGAPKEVLDLFNKTKFIEIEARLATTNAPNQSVQIREDYYMDVKVGVKIIGKVKI
jgi:hypothetical protein